MINRGNYSNRPTVDASTWKQIRALSNHISAPNFSLPYPVILSSLTDRGEIF